MNERLRILKLLEDGKINADEAARLLEALSYSESMGRKGPYRIWSSFESIPEVIASAIKGSFKNFSSKETLSFPKKEHILFKGISGGVEITGDAADTIEIEKDGFAKIMERNNTLMIKAISGDLKMRTPSATHFTIRGISGNVKISQLNGTIEIASVSGNIMGQELSGSFTGDFVSGDVDLDYKKIDKVLIKSKSGDIILRLDEEVEITIDVETKHGGIECDFELHDKEKHDNRLRGVINKPVGTIEIKNEYGDIAIKKR